MISHSTDAVTGVVTITVDGAMEGEAVADVIAALDAAIARDGRLRVVEVIRHVGRIDPAIWWQDVRWVATHMGRISRAAVVTDNGLIGPVSRAVAALLPADIRVFPLAEADAARRWAAEG